MSTFYQIVTKEECDGGWGGFFADHPEIYRSYDEAYKKAEELAIAKTQEPFKDYLHVQYRTENDQTIIELFSDAIDDVLKEYHIKELTLAESK